MLKSFWVIEMGTTDYQKIKSFLERRKINISKMSYTKMTELVEQMKLKEEKFRNVPSEKDFKTVLYSFNGDSVEY